MADISHTVLSDGKVALRGSDDEAQDILARQAAFDVEVASGKCHICGGKSEPGTRYCGGDRGCQNHG